VCVLAIGGVLGGILQWGVLRVWEEWSGEWGRSRRWEDHTKLCRGFWISSGVDFRGDSKRLDMVPGFS
jgi:hypothetical protein